MVHFSDFSVFAEIIKKFLNKRKKAIKKYKNSTKNLKTNKFER